MKKLNLKNPEFLLTRKEMKAINGGYSLFCRSGSCQLYTGTLNGTVTGSCESFPYGGSGGKSVCRCVAGSFQSSDSGRACYG